MSNALQERILALAREYTPRFVTNNTHKPDELPAFALRLAKESHLVIAGQVAPDADIENAVTMWSEGYIRLYRLLANVLFPSQAQVTVRHLDVTPTPIAWITGDSLAVIVALAQFVSPYLAARQKDSIPSELELTALMDAVLEYLVIDDLTHDEARRLRDDALVPVRTLFIGGVRQYALCQPHMTLKHLNLTAPADAPKRPPMPPANLPEAPPAPDVPANPVSMKPQNGTESPLPRPPLPDLPPTS